jgi:hypothetical protein
MIKLNNMKKMKIISLLVIVLVVALGYLSLVFFQKARVDRSWPFNSRIGQKLPDFVKYWGYLLTNPEEKTISSSFGNLNLDYHQIPSTSATGGGGAIEVLKDHIILTTLDNGEMFLFNSLTKNFSTNPSNLMNNYASIRDTFLNKESFEFLVLAVVDNEDGCKKIKLDIFDYYFDGVSFMIDNPKTVWESEKACDLPTHSGASGRIAFFQENYFISTGYFNGMVYSDFESSMNPFPQSPTSSFGKVIKFDRTNGYEASIFSLGHRAPQGLFVSSDNMELLLSEIGQKGGDEFNLILEGLNYGWPCKTPGTLYAYPNYSTVPWPEDLSMLGCLDDEFEEPLFSWGPVIAISQGFQYSGKYFENLDNSFVFGSLAGLSLFVIASEDGKMIDKGSIKIGERIRDIIQTYDQKIALYTDGGSLIIVSNEL